MEGLTFYFKIIQALEEIAAPYMIVGAFAGLAFGVNRATFDVDILVDLHEDDFEALADRFPPPRYYADPEMMRNSTRMGIMFNLIDTEEGVKADLVPLTREPGYRVAFDRRVRQTYQDETGQVFAAWYAQPTDIIIGKLKAWAQGRSAKHPADIHAMLVFALSDLSTIALDFAAIAAAAARLGPDVSALWNSLLNRAQHETPPLSH
ncbi:MAG TPA: hypothetical protein PKH77_11770 [Anaerolineae bacterium]|nr:hypothetical protein [Anaerolineae bacterium]